MRRDSQERQPEDPFTQRIASGDAATPAGLLAERAEHPGNGLSENKVAFQALVQQSQDIITVHDRKGVTLYESPSAARVLGYPAGALIGKVPFGSIHPQDATRARAAFNTLVEGDQPAGPMEFRFRRADGTWIHLEALGSNLLDHPSIGGIVLASRDVSERKKAERRAQHPVQHDALTGLPNRMLMQRQLNQALSRARDSGGVVALMVIDLDRFELVNDSFGYPRGDALLKEVAQRVKSCLRDTDTVARLAGDEFTVVLPDLATASSRRPGCEPRPAAVLASLSPGPTRTRSSFRRASASACSRAMATTRSRC